MSKSLLKSLTITHLRGAIEPVTLSFEKNKPLTIIYGENGTGKSTICDALDFLGKGKVGSLDGRGLGGGIHAYWSSIGKQTKDIAVMLETATGCCAARLEKRDVIVDLPENRPKVEVLRRSQILSLIEAKAGERYKAIQHFIDFSGVEASEKRLREQVNELKKQCDVVDAEVYTSHTAIKRFWEQSGQSNSEPSHAELLVWAKAEINQEVKHLETTKNAIETLKYTLRDLTGYPAQYQAHLEKLRASETAMQQAAQLVAELKQQAADEYLAMLPILQAAQQHFAQHPHLQVCPLCESAENAQGLAEKVNARLTAHNVAHKLKAAQSDYEEKSCVFDNKKSQLETFKLSALNKANEFLQHCQSSYLPKATPLPTLSYPNQLYAWGAWLNECNSYLIEWNKIADNCVEQQKFIRVLKKSVQDLEENQQKQGQLGILLPNLKTALEIVETERRQFTDQILHDIAAEVGRLYEVIHPSEGLNCIVLALDPKKRASLEITGDFRGQSNTPPPAYFSDSHLDTLGLCIFIALAKREQPEHTILVLDDILGSVDEPHVERLIDMLYQESQHFQHCIMTTHYKPWKQKLLWGWFKHPHCQLIELNRWRNETGIVLKDSLSEYTKLRQLLNDNQTDEDIQSICAKAGVILEALLDFLTLRYGCSLPRRPDGMYTLGELFRALDKKLKSALRVEVKQTNTTEYTEIQLAPYLDKLSDIAQARNIFGCHFNTLSFELLDSDAIGFGQIVLELADCLIDEQTGFPKSNKSGCYWATTGETRRLYPLLRPR